MANLYTLLQAGFPQDATRAFATLRDGTVISYAGLEQASARYANMLVSLGVECGDRVAVQAPKSMDMPMLYLGCLRAGAVFLPLNPAYTAGELDYFMRDARPALFVCDPTQVEAIRALAQSAGLARVETLGENGAGSLPALAAECNADFVTVELPDDDLVVRF